MSTTSPLSARRTAALGAAAASAVLVSVLGVTPAQAATGPGVCPTNGLIKLASTLSNGTVKLGSQGSVTGSTGRACGKLVLKGGKTYAVIAPSNTAFAPVMTKVGLLSFPTTLRSVSSLQGPSAFVGSALSAQLTGKVLATSDIMGQKCDIPLTLHLTTGKSGALMGSNFKPGANNIQKGKLVDGTFTVPAIQASATCNVVVATLANTMLGLPLAAGKSSISYDATIKLS